MIKAIFFSKFDTSEGPKVVHQVPEGAIVPSPHATQSPFFTFSDISIFVIPRQELCGNLLQVCNNGYRVLGYPICLRSLKYDRNEFIFNFCIVLAEDADFSTYKSVVEKLADLMRGLEEQSGFLYKDLSKQNTGKVYSLCEMLMEDLNNYCECMIPLDEVNTLNIKLFPTYPSPAPVRAWQVPLFTVRYESLMDENWDLTMQRIVPHINGINSVKHIALAADADFTLTLKALKHLLYYGCLLLLDIFSFNAIYAPTAQFATIVEDKEMQRECARYVNTVYTPGGPLGMGMVAPAAIMEQNDVFLLNANREMVDGVAIVELYAALKQGQSVKQWYAEYRGQLANIDVRRFITFGVIKGFLYRVHKYAYASGPRTVPRQATIKFVGGVRQGRPGGSRRSIYSETMGSDDEDVGDDEGEELDARVLAKYLDGTHCFDQICTELDISEKELTAKLKRYGEVQIIHR